MRPFWCDVLRSWTGLFLACFLVFCNRSFSTVQWLSTADASALLLLAGRRVLGTRFRSAAAGLRGLCVRSGSAFRVSIENDTVGAVAQAIDSRGPHQFVGKRSAPF